jgi:hypothetical protein
MFRFTPRFKFTLSMCLLVLGAMLFSFADDLAPAGADASCPEFACPSGQICCGGSCIDPAVQGCCGDIAYNLNEGCCIDE